MNEKKKSMITSLWFTTVMSVVAILMFCENAVTFYSGDTRNLIGTARVTIWLLIAYHFISLTSRSWKQSSRQFDSR